MYIDIETINVKIMENVRKRKEPGVYGWTEYTE